MELSDLCICGGIFDAKTGKYTDFLICGSFADGLATPFPATRAQVIALMQDGYTFELSKTLCGGRHIDRRIFLVDINGECCFHMKNGKLSPGHTQLQDSLLIK